MRKKIYLIALFLIFLVSANAQWTATSGPYGGNIQSLKRSSSGGTSGNLYAVINQKLYQSTNNGDNWTANNASLYLNDLMIDTDGKMYAVNYSVLYSSSDNGTTWTSVSSNLFQSCIHIDKVGPDGVFVVWGYSGVYVSIDKGVSWTQISSLNFAQNGGPSVVSNAAGDIFYATSSNQIWKHPYKALTTNWSPSNMTQTPYSIPAGDYINNITIDGAGRLYVVSYYDLFKSTDAGGSFTSIKASLAPATYFNGNLGTDGSAVYLFSNAQAKIYKSIDQGASWTSTASPTVSYGSNVIISLFTSSSTFFIGTSGDGVFRTTDTGATWLFKSTGLTGGNYNDIVVASTTNKLIVVKGGSGYWSSTDGGVNWTINSLSSYTNHAMKLANGNIILYGSRVYRSTDNGATFTDDGVSYGDVKIVEASNGDLYGFRYGKISKSVNSGATWSDLTITGLPSPASFYFQGAAIDATTNFIFQLYDQNVSQYKLFKMVGTTATLLTSPYTSNFSNVFFQNSKFYVAQYSSYYYTTDLGANWTTVGFSGNAVFPVKNVSYSGVAVSKNGSLYISQDDGGSWNNSTLPAATPNAYITSIGTDASGNYFAAANGASVLKFTSALLVDPTTLPAYINFNWQPLSGPYGGRVTKIQSTSDGNTLFAVVGQLGSTSRLWKYSGTTWTQVNPISASGVIWDVEVDASGNVYALTNSNPQKVYKSVDLGATWNPLTSTSLPGTGSSIRRIEVLSDGSILAFGSNGTKGAIYKSSDDGASFTVKFTSASSTNIFYGADANTSSRKPAVSPSGAIAIFGLPSEGLLVSTNNGDTWSVITLPASMLDPTNGFVGSYMYDKDGNLIMHTIVDTTIPLWSTDVWKSANNGATWVALNTPTVSTPGGTGNYSKRVIALGTGEYLMCIQSQFDCYRSTDKGATWINIGNVGDVFIWSYTIGTTSYILGSSDAGILKTTDGGQNFSAFSNGIPHPSANEITLLNNKDMVVGATRPYYSSDFGQTFTLANREPASKYLQVGDSLIGYGGNRRMLKSKDGGKTWAEFGADLLYYSFLTKDATGNGFYGSDGTSLKYSTDLINWTNIVLSGLPSSYSINSMVIDSGGVIYAVVFDGNSSLNDVYKIVFGSATKISSVIGTTSPGNIKYINNKIYLYDTQGAIYKSTDGEIWTQGSAPAGNSLVTTNGYLFIPSSGSVLWLSRNDGSTWQSVGDTPPTSGLIPIFRNVVINEYDGYAYATLSNSTARKSGNMVMPNDNTKPVVVTYDPVNLATSIGLKPTLTLTFDEITNAVAGKLVRVFDLANQAVPIETLDMSTAVQSNKSWLIPTTATLSFDKTYFVVVDAGAVADIFGNTYNGISSSSTWRFTTKNSPSVSALSPATAATNQSLNTNFVISFSEPVSGVGGKNLTIYASSAPSTPVTTVGASAGVSSGNNITYALSAGTLQYGTQYFIKFDAGAFTTADGGVFSALTLNTDWTFTTRAAPTLALLLPTNSATNVDIVAANTKLEITLSENFTFAASKKVYVTNTAAPSTPVFSINLSTAVFSGAKATITMPSDLSYSLTYSVTFDANAFVAASDGGTFSLLTSTGWQFSTVAPPDAAPPSITHAPVSFSKGSGNGNISATITDNIGVTQAKIFYRSITTTNAFASADLTLNSGLYSISIPESTYGSMGLEYYLTASDAAGNSARSPATGNNYSYITNSTQAKAQIPQSLIGQGGQIDNWRIITIPHALADSKVSTVFNVLGAGDFSQWRLITLKTQTSWAQYPSDFTAFTQGKGYFINVKSLPSNSAAGLTIEGATTPSNNKATPFVFTLAPGWNQIGNPYSFPMEWIETLAANSNPAGIATILKTFTGNYIDVPNSGKLDVFEGAFVLNSNTTAITITVPITGKYAGGRVAALQPSKINHNLASDDWIAPITLKIGSVENTFGGVGMNPKASLGVDDLDDFNPPHWLEYAELEFPHPEHFLKQSTRDIVPTQTEYEWYFTVSTNVNEPAELKWDNTTFGSSTKELFLVDLNREALVNMREQNSYAFDPKKSSSFKIYFGDDLKTKIKPQTVSLGDAYPNPNNNSKVTIPFTLPDSQSSYQVLLEVYNSMGQKVSTLISGSFNSGFYSSQWEPNEELISGLYVYRIKVAGKENSSVLSKKIIVTH